MHGSIEKSTSICDFFGEFLSGLFEKMSYDRSHICEVLIYHEPHFCVSSEKPQNWKIFHIIHIDAAAFYHEQQQCVSIDIVGNQMIFYKFDIAQALLFHKA